MAVCNVCGKKISMLNTYTISVKDEESNDCLYLDACEECANEWSSAIKGTNDEFQEIENRIVATGTDKGMEFLNAFLKINPSYNVKTVEEFQKNQQAKLEKDTESLDNMILCTCNVLDGYRIIDYLGLVSGEIILKMSLKDSFKAFGENIGAAFDFTMTEMPGSMKILNKAKEYSTNKMKSEALEKGANAIIGIDAESSVGGEIMHVTIMGTAVRVEKIC